MDRRWFIQQSSATTVVHLAMTARTRQLSVSSRRLGKPGHVFTIDRVFALTYRCAHSFMMNVATTTRRRIGPLDAHPRDESSNEGSFQEDDFEEDTWPTSTEKNTTAAAVDVGNSCMSILSHAEQGVSILQHLPDAVVDMFMEKYGIDEISAVSDFHSLKNSDEIHRNIALAMSNTPEFRLNSYTWRAVLFGKPHSVDFLSTLRVKEDRVVQRYLIETDTGERMVLSLDLRLEETLQPKYRGIQVIKEWFLYGITGEELWHEEYPKMPGKEYGPESVVGAQMEAFREGDIESVFHFLSPKAKQDRFGDSIKYLQDMLRNDIYLPLLSINDWEILQSAQLSREKAMIVVGIESKKQKFVYIWSMGLCAQSTGELVWLNDTFYCMNS